MNETEMIVATMLTAFILALSIYGFFHKESFQ